MGLDREKSERHTGRHTPFHTDCVKKYMPKETVNHGWLTSKGHCTMTVMADT